MKPSGKSKRVFIEDRRPAIFTLLDENASTADGKPVRIRCEQMSVADEVNGNGRVYPYETWKREIDKLQEKLAQGRLVGSADHPADGRSKIGETSIKWEKLYMDGKTTVGEGVIVPTAVGKDLEALIRADVVVDVSSRGFGSALERMVNGQRALVVQEDFELLTFDAVLGGSVPNAHLAVVESEQGGSKPMDWKQILEGLRKEHPDVFVQYEKEIKDALSKEFEQKVLDEVKKQKADEAVIRDAVRAEVLEELKPQLEAMDAMEAILENIRSLVGDGDAAAADPKLKEQAEAAVRDKNVAEQKVKDLTAQLAAASARHTTELTEATSKHTAALDEANARLAVRIAVDDATVGKPFRIALVERLTVICKKPEEVAAKMPEAEAYVKRLLTENAVVATSGEGSGAGTGAGRGKVEDDDQTKKTDGALTEQQKRMRDLAGVR